MGFNDLERKKLIERYSVSKEEIGKILEAARHDIKTAQELLSTDVCWAFIIAYNALLETGIALMYSKGFRPVGEAKHVSVILFLRDLCGKEYEGQLDRFDQMRRRRNKSVYSILRDVTEYEAKDTVKFAADFHKEIITFILA